MASVLIPLAPGFEDLEAITVIDLLRRANIKVVTAGLEEGPIRGSRGTAVLPDMTLDEALAANYDMVVLPGGQPGATHLEQDTRIIDLIRRMNSADKYTAAICAAPKVLATAGVLKGKRATSYPGTLDPKDYPDISVKQSVLQSDGKVITSRGPGTAIDFALKLIQCLVGDPVREQVEKALQRPETHSSQHLRDWN